VSEVGTEGLGLWGMLDRGWEGGGSSSSSLREGAAGVGERGGAEEEPGGLLE
jgi:hypothetical protein